APPQLIKLERRPSSRRARIAQTAFQGVTPAEASGAGDRQMIISKARKGHTYRTSLAASVALSALVAVAAHPAAAQEAAQVEEVMVTASRVVRDGYEAPTPTTVIGAEDIAQAAPANIADYVNQLPSLAGSSSPRTGNTGTATA